MKAGRYAYLVADLRICHVSVFVARADKVPRNHAKRVHIRRAAQAAIP